MIENYVLRQNYPNPFNPQTTIGFDIKTAAEVNLTVYNATGERVAELVNRQLPAGSYTATFDGKNLSSGVYFYSLRTGDFVATRSMVLLK
ncbi:MAG: T9SS type A sorting domain-containing protein [Calditrichia bacterium]